MAAQTRKDFALLHAEEVFFHTICDERARDAEALARALKGRLCGRCLDFGCGDGQLLAQVLERSAPNFDLQLTLVDIDAHYRSAALRRLQNHCVEATSIWPDKTFDLILASHVLYYVSDVAVWLRRACASLRPQGLLAILMGASDTPFSDVWSQLFARAGEALPYVTAKAVKQNLRGKSPRILRVPFRFDFPDTKTNRELLLRFLLGDAYQRLIARIDLRTTLDRFMVRGRIFADHADELILVTKPDAA